MQNTVKNMFCVVEPACDELDIAVTFFGLAYVRGSVRSSERNFVMCWQIVIIFVQMLALCCDDVNGTFVY